MHTAYLQYSPLLAQPGANLDKLSKLIESQVAHMHVDVLVLPELANSGYNLKSKERVLATAEKLESSPFIDALTRICARHRMYIVTGFNEREADFCYNSAVLIGPEGYVGRYRKLHLFWNELDYFEPGNLGLPVFDLGFCKLGMLVCFDWIFPEVWRILALKGADLICHPSNLVLPGLCQKAVPVHAMVNRVYVVTANRIGTEDELTFTGNSLIADARGRILVEAPTSKEHFGACEIDVGLARNKQVTPRNDIFQDRRQADYVELVRF